MAKRRQIREWYRERLTAVPGVVVQSDPTWGQSNAWLTVARFSPNANLRCMRHHEKRRP